MKISKSNRKSLIRLASSLPAGSDERRSILAAVKGVDLFSQKESEVMGQLQGDLADIGSIFGGNVTDAVGVIKDIEIRGNKYVAKGIVVVEGTIEFTEEEDAMMIAQELKKAGLGDLGDGSRVDFGFDVMDSYLFTFDLPGPALIFGLQGKKMVVMSGNGPENDLEPFFETIKRLGGDPGEAYNYLVRTFGYFEDGPDEAQELADYADYKVVSNAREAAAAAKKMSQGWTKMFNKVVAYWKKNGLPSPLYDRSRRV